MDKEAVSITRRLLVPRTYRLVLREGSFCVALAKEP